MTTWHEGASNTFQAPKVGIPKISHPFQASGSSRSTIWMRLSWWKSPSNLLKREMKKAARMAMILSWPETKKFNMVRKPGIQWSLVSRMAMIHQTPPLTTFLKRSYQHAQHRHKTSTWNDQILLHRLLRVFQEWSNRVVEHQNEQLWE